MLKNTRLFFAAFVAGFAIFAASTADAQTVIASEDFDGNAVNLISGFDPGSGNIDEIEPFIFFGVTKLDDFSSLNPAPFALVDDSVVDVANGGDLAPFPADLEGIFGMNRDVSDNFFAGASADPAATGTGSFDIDDLAAEWTFDISSATGPLTLSIDMGQMSSDFFDGVGPDNFVLIECSFDSGPFNEVILISPLNLAGSGFTYRAFDDGDEETTDFDGDGAHFGTSATGPNPITKTIVGTGEVDDNTILDKTPADGDFAGLMDNFSTPLDGSGSTVTLRLTTLFPFEAWALDNIAIIEGEDAEVILGDVNLDGVVDLFDVSPFVSVLTSGDFQAEADIDGNGIVDLFDVSPFVAILTGG